LGEGVVSWKLLVRRSSRRKWKISWWDRSKLLLLLVPIQLLIPNGVLVSIGLLVPILLLVPIGLLVPVGLLLPVWLLIIICWLVLLMLVAVPESEEVLSDC